MFIKALEYETVNPDQDGTGEEVRHFDPQNRKVVPGPVDDVDEFSQSPPNKANKNGQVSAGNVNQRVGTLTGTDLMNDGRTALEQLSTDVIGNRINTRPQRYL